MPNYIFAFCFFVMTIILDGCVSSRNSSYVLVDRVIIKNATVDKITDVKIRHKPTNKIGGVSAILPQKSLDIGFSPKPLIAVQAVIYWTDGAGT